jgi:hypothetical protein
MASSSATGSGELIAKLRFCYSGFILVANLPNYCVSGSVCTLHYCICLLFWWIGLWFCEKLVKIVVALVVVIVLNLTSSVFNLNMIKLSMSFYCWYMLVLHLQNLFFCTILVVHCPSHSINYVVFLHYSSSVKFVFLHYSSSNFNCCSSSFMCCSSALF